MSAEFLKSMDTETSAITVIMSTYFISVSGTCLLANTLFKKYSMRFVGLIGAMLYFLSSLMNIFAISIEMLVISYGFLQGLDLELRFAIHSKIIEITIHSRLWCWIHASSCVWHIQSIFYQETSFYDGCF